MCFAMYRSWREIFILGLTVLCAVGEVMEQNSTSVGSEETEVPVVPITTTPSFNGFMTSTDKLSEEITMEKTSPFAEMSSPTESIVTGVLHSTEAVTEGANEPTKSQETSSTITEAQTVTDSTKEKAPTSTFAVWDHNEKICLLTKFHAVFTITYPSKGGEQSVTVELPRNPAVKGKCGIDVKSPVISLSWDEFGFTITFLKSPKQADKWIVNRVALRYDTSVPLFDGATNSGKKTAQSKDVELFETDIGRSYFCPTAKLISLYRSNKKVASVSLTDIQLQPFEVEDGKFSEAQRCSEVSIASPEVTVQDETVPLAVGLTLTILTLIVVLGFSIRRAYTMRKVDYNGME